MRGLAALCGALLVTACGSRAPAITELRAFMAAQTTQAEYCRRGQHLTEEAHTLLRTNSDPASVGLVLLRKYSQPSFTDQQKVQLEYAMMGYAEFAFGFQRRDTETLAIAFEQTCRFQLKGGQPSFDSPEWFARVARATRCEEQPRGDARDECVAQAFQQP